MTTYVTFIIPSVFYSIFADPSGERIKLSVNYDERFGVTITGKEGQTESLDML